MAKRINPATSKEAFASLKPDQIRAIYQKIIEALKVLGTASSEQIAIHLTMDHAKIHKRTKEMETLEIIFRPGNRVATRSGRTAFVWCLCNNQPKVERGEKSLPGKGVSDYSREILKNKPGPHQAALFIDGV